jgi:hypothetical protein
MVSIICGKMVNAASAINSVQISALVFVGKRDWTSLSRWEKINVCVLSVSPLVEVSASPSLRPKGRKRAPRPGSWPLAPDAEVALRHVCHQQVVLAAKDYFEVRSCRLRPRRNTRLVTHLMLCSQHKRGIAKVLHAAGAFSDSTGFATPLQSLVHHLHSLTARQSRRSGISEMKLRSRWGDGGGL